MLGKRAQLYAVALLISGFFFLVLTDEGFSGIAPVEDSCCMFAEDACINLSDLPPNATCLTQDVVENAFCDESRGQCIPILSTSNIPTLSEWGLISMAGILGLAGLLYARRRKAAA